MVWRSFAWLLPALLALATLSFGWWRLSQEPIRVLPPVTEAVTGSSVPAQVIDILLPDSEGETTAIDLVTEESAQEAPEFSTTIDGDEIEAQALDRPVKDGAEAQALDGRLTVAASSPDNERLHVVRPGETLYAIARQHGVGVDSLLTLNSLRNPNLLWVGQRLHLPPAESGPALPDATIAHIVEPGESLLTIAVRYKASLWTIAVASGVRNPSLIYPGQRLLVPGQDSALAGDPSPPHPTPAAEGKWIDVDLTAQRMVAYEGAQPVFSALVSTGLPGTPTVTGRYRIYLKYRSQTMYGGNRASGDYYYLPDVPYVQYFYQGYAFHGTYWHANFGQPMSRGCVNMRTDDARWLFEWAEPAAPAGQNQTWADDGHTGTLVVIHY
jgi:lipoprotein-anchoring transpeptidase ErfK/SrfK